MSIGILKRSLIALLMLALASVWQVVPTFAAQPCDTDSETMLATSHSAGAGHCKEVAGDCTKAAICCQVSPNLLGVSNSVGTPIDWEPIVYPVDTKTFVGLSLKPDLHPPQFASSGIRTAFGRCACVGRLKSTQTAAAHAGSPSVAHRRSA